MSRRPVRAHLGTALWVSLTLFGSACEEEETCPPLVVRSSTECQTTQDCVDEGFSTLRCVNGVCALPCTSDEQCRLGATDECVEMAGGLPAAVCERQICQTACPDRPCPSGLTCHLGRCVIAAEDFELQSGETVASFERLGWNAIPAGPDRLLNPTLRIVERGRPGCFVGDDDCAGMPASGERFAVIGTQPTSEKGSATFGPTCRPCACCLECIVSPYPADPDILSRCPLSSFVPAPLMCPAMAPSCAAVCQACDQCANAPSTRETLNLVPCEASAAGRICPACPRCDGAACRTCREEVCSSACSEDIEAQACRDCENVQCPTCADCRSCDVCGEAVNCEITDPNAAACRQRRQECDQLGNDGCYPTPIRYERSELLPLEQALVSPEYDLSSRAGGLVLVFSYVPFQVGEDYFESQQFVPASMWMRRTQEVRVELCAGDCTMPASWRPAMVPNGETASFPPLGRRDNGLSLGRQSLVDWRSGQVEVNVPQEFRTSTFRFRFLPRLASEAIVAIDDIRLEVR